MKKTQSLIAILKIIIHLFASLSWVLIFIKDWKIATFIFFIISSENILNSDKFKSK